MDMLNLTNNSNNKQSGFTLLEVLVALVIFAFSMISMGRLMISATESNRDARRVTAATVLTMDKLEELRLAARSTTDYGNLASSTAIEFINEEGVVSSPNDVVANAFYERTWTVTPDTPEVDSSTISVQVQWFGSPDLQGNRVKQTVSLNTVVAQPN